MTVTSMHSVRVDEVLFSNCAPLALIAFPAKYGDSGVMTFVVNQAGIVFEKNLGPNTASVATAIAEFNPDATWKTR